MSVTPNEKTPSPIGRTYYESIKRINEKTGVREPQRFLAAREVSRIMFHWTSRVAQDRVQLFYKWKQARKRRDTEGHQRSSRNLPVGRKHYGYNPHLPQHIYLLGYFSGLFLDLLTHWLGRTHERITLDIAKFTSRVAITPTTKH